MDTLTMPVLDLLKYYIERNYIQFDDTKLNILLYSVVSIGLSLIVKYIFKFDMYIKAINYIQWFITYKFFRKEIFKFPVDCRSNLFSPLFEENDLKVKELRSENSQVFRELLSLKIEHANQGNNTNAVAYIHNFKLPKNNISNNENNKFVISQKSLAYFLVPKWFNDSTNNFNYLSNYKIIAYINGYYILINYKDFTPESSKNEVSIFSNNTDALNLFMDYLQFEIDNNKDKLFKNTNILGIYETDKNNILQFIGSVKKHLNFDNYVSRHKNNIIKKLDAVMKGKLYDHPYIENNLGFLLHGDYGTGKTFLISAIANYMNRSIINVNFTKINTKSAFKAIMADHYIKQYIYSFDEFDYLITDLINEEKNNNQSDDIKMKIQVLSTQIGNCTDKEAAKPLIEEMKKLMENGNSDKLTYAHLLTELSGLSSTTDRVIVATTNFPDKIPPALLRPGRLDNIIHLDKFNNDEIKELLVKIYKPNAEQYKLIKDTQFPDNKYTPALIIRESCSCDSLEDIIKSLISCKLQSNF